MPIGSKPDARVRAPESARRIAPFPAPRVRQVRGEARQLEEAVSQAHRRFGWSFLWSSFATPLEDEQEKMNTRPIIARS
jgi:hypothetical protein